MGATGHHASNTCTYVVKEKKMLCTILPTFLQVWNCFKIKKDQSINLKRRKKPIWLETLALSFAIWTVRRVLDIHGCQFQLYGSVLTSSQEWHAKEKACVFVFYCCVTNDHKLGSLKWYPFFISQFCNPEVWKTWLSSLLRADIKGAALHSHLEPHVFSFKLILVLLTQFSSLRL